ncbi:chaperone NapD [Photobacterium sagamiensis]|uniref:chaperone NapD n=1 Tax=Photobacterium sagamiensis TaxID=2910241 RepID=UPI003D133020
MAQQEVHISSLVVHVKPDHLEVVKTQILDFPNTEIHGESEAGKIIVVLETANQGYVTDTIDKINNLEHVLITFLVYHQIEHFDPQSEDDS